MNVRLDGWTLVAYFDGISHIFSLSGSMAWSILRPSHPSSLPRLSSRWNEHPVPQWSDQVSLTSHVHIHAFPYPCRFQCILLLFFPSPTSSPPSQNLFNTSGRSRPSMSPSVPSLTPFSTNAIKSRGIAAAVPFKVCANGNPSFSWSSEANAE